MKPLTQPTWISIAVVAAGAAACAMAHAEYRCATPDLLSYEEVRACELARRDMPDALIHYVNRTKVIYGLYVNDYVGDADVERWEAARQKAQPGSPEVANESHVTKSGAKSD
ncbi:MAG TPA: hypothetical protein VH278_01330 [Burkholderiaceae bacterium]|nr:hypothetical protein [Burkholderiaceae bacterium]